MHLHGGGGGVLAGELSIDLGTLMALVERRERIRPTTQATSKIASLTLDSSNGSHLYTHHLRDTMTRNSPSFLLLGNFFQSSLVLSLLVNGQLRGFCHNGWAAPHHSIHLSSKSLMDVMTSKLLGVESRQPPLNHVANW